MEFRPLFRAALALLIFAPVLSLAGDGDQAPTTAGEAQPITMTEAIHLALENNLDIRASRLDVTIADAQRRGAYADFDPKFDLLSQYENTRIPQNASQYASTGFVTTGPQRVYFEENYRFHFSLQGKTTLGTQYSLTAQDDRLVNSVNRDATYSLFSPEYQTFVGLQIRQPLLKDFGPDASLAAVRIGQKNKEISQLTWRGKVIDSISSVMTTYYQMLFAKENVRLKEQAIAADQKLVDQNRRRLELGFMSPIDVRQAEVAVSTDQEDLLVAQDYLKQQQFALKQQVFSDLSQDSGRDFDPVTGLYEMPLPAKTRGELLREAFTNRYDYQVAFKVIEQEKIRVRYAKNQLYPNIDLVGSYGVNGLRGAYDRSFSSAFEAHTPQWTLGVEISFPLGNIQGKAQFAQVNAQKAQALVKLKQLEIKVALDVDAALSHLETTRQRVVTSHNSTRLAEDALKIANGQLDQGLLSSFDVIDQKKKLDDARMRELQSIADLNISLVQLWVATGTLLDRENIVIKE